MSWTKYINTIVKADCWAIMRDMPDKAVKILITDPPYGKDIAKTGTLAIKGSSDKKNEFIPSAWDVKPSKRYFYEMDRVSENQIIFGGNYFTDYLRPSSCWLVWYKKERLPSKTFADAEMIWTSFDGPARVFAHRWHGYIRDGDDKRYPHATQKPEALLEWIIDNYTKEGDLILDPFVGSGTTCAVAKQRHRRFIGIERQDEYYEMAKKRVESTVKTVRGW